MKCRIIKDLRDKKCPSCGCIDMNVNILGKVVCSRCETEIKK